MKLLLLFACLATIPMKGITEGQLPPYRQISSIEVVFTTTSGSKPDDTGLNIQFETASKDTIASKSGQFGKFEKNTSNAVDLEVLGTYSDKDLPNSSLNLHVTPTGTPNWNFDVEVTIIWSNGNHTLANASSYSLAQNGNNIEIDMF